MSKDTPPSLPRFAGSEDSEPPELDLHTPRWRRAMARVGETLAVGRAAVQLRDATDPVVRAVLEQIIADETRHAQLAWDTVRWALSVGGAAVHDALADELAALTLSDEPRQPGLGRTRAHGLAETREVMAALGDLLDDVIRPTAAELLAA